MSDPGSNPSAHVASATETVSGAPSAAEGGDARESKLRDAEAKGRAEGKLALYFGCWDTTGHYLHGPGGRDMWDAKRNLPGFPWSEAHIDTGLLENGRHPDVYDGKVFSTCGGLSFWWAFIWWDNSIDRRGASNSGFYVRGFDHAERDAAFAYACEQFPKIVARQKHPLILQEARSPGGASPTGRELGPGRPSPLSKDNG